MPALLEAARAPDPRLRLCAYAGLGWIPDDRGHGALVEALGRDPELGDVAAMALGDEGRPDALCGPLERQAERRAERVVIPLRPLEEIVKDPPEPDEPPETCEECGAPLERPTGVPACPETADNLAEGVGEQEILEEYPQLAPEDIRAAIAYGAEMAHERLVEIPTDRPA